MYDRKSWDLPQKSSASEDVRKSLSGLWKKKKIGASSEIFLMKLHIITKFGMRFIFGLNKKESEKCDIESHRDKKKKIIVI